MTRSTTTPRNGRGVTGRRRARRRPARNKILLGLVLVVVFAVGVALGQALHDNPRPGGVQTSFRTLPPLTATRSG
ncbi:MAG: hypothetical protein AUH17_00710 [Actinobacteria bacterium 13_2_20CM_68_14]|nr:MAG: hypothetical protein AUH17_00710 [Actinobacteria bacterium 13_2_20CM_68_14]OLE19247.1 MAG: hypothetical protein AUG88_01510 [Actinobacteria bacterium 13_1_20CM_4_68_12]